MRREELEREGWKGGRLVDLDELLREDVIWWANLSGRSGSIASSPISGPLPRRSGTSLPASRPSSARQRRSTRRQGRSSSKPRISLSESEGMWFDRGGVPPLAITGGLGIAESHGERAEHLSRAAERELGPLCRGRTIGRSSSDAWRCSMRSPWLSTTKTQPSKWAQASLGEGHLTQSNPLLPDSTRGP